MGLINVDDVAQSQRWDARVEQFLLENKNDEYYEDEDSITSTKSLRDSSGFVYLRNKHITGILYFILLSLTRTWLIIGHFFASNADWNPEEQSLQS